MSLLEIGKNIIVGGSIEGSLTFFAEYLDHRFSAIFWAFPSVLVATIVLLCIDNTPLAKIKGLSRASFYSTVKLTTFFIIFLSLVSSDYLKKNKYRIPIAYTIGCIGYLVLAFLFLYL